MNGGSITCGREAPDNGAGVYFLLSNRARDALMSYKPISDIIISARFRAQPFNMTVIQVYSPTDASTVEDIEGFHN